MNRLNHELLPNVINMPPRDSRDSGDSVIHNCSLREETTLVNQSQYEHRDKCGAGVCPPAARS